MSAPSRDQTGAVAGATAGGTPPGAASSGGAPGRWTVGAVTVTRVVEQGAAIPAGGFFPTADDDGLARHRGWLAPWAMDDDGRLLLSIHALCVESEGHRIVVDTCVGQRPLPELFAHMSDDGSFLDALASAGFARESVDTVVCTHLHFDHVGWNTMWVDGRWVPTFPNARYVLAAPEHEHWSRETAEARAAASAVTFDDAVAPLFEHGVVDLVAPDHAVTGEVSLFPTPGHTPGHVSVRIRSGGEEAVITGDCVHHAVQLAEPGWYTSVDTDGAQSSATRRALVDDCLARDVLVIGTHFPEPTAGHLERTEDGGVRFRPLGG